VDQHLAQLSHQVATAADAWLTDPRDSGVYVRLVRAIEAYRHYRQPELPAAESEVDLSGPPVGRVDEEELLDGLADCRAPKSLGEGLKATRWLRSIGCARPRADRRP